MAWNSKEIFFDEEGRLVIKNEDLAKEISNKFTEDKFLILRIHTFDGQRRWITKDLDPPRGIKLKHDHKPITGSITPWPGMSPWAGRECGDPPGPGMVCDPAPPPTDLGCGCDIRMNSGC